MSPDDLTVITCYFNPEHYKTRRANYTLFRNRLKLQGVPCLTVECVLGDAFPELEPEPDVFTVRARDSLWQKERLLNLALDQVGSRYTKIAWLDCDVLFSDHEWASKTSDLLDLYLITQPFNRVVWLPKEGPDSQVSRTYLPSFAADVYLKEPLPKKINQHGHTGFAWAARRRILDKHHFYDAAILGHGDHFIGHAIHGDWESVCLPFLMPSPRFFEHFLKWAQPFYGDVLGSFAPLKGELQHLWHGEPAHRAYRTRHRKLGDYAYNPELDLKLNSHGTWDWASDKPELHAWVHNYFKTRREDG